MKNKVISIEIKAKVENLNPIILILEKTGAKYIGTDEQSDTYFNVAKGRLKLREGIIENNLIQYQRPESKHLKKSKVKLFPMTKGDNTLKNILTDSLGIKVVVKKVRRIYFIDNVKFHIDVVENLGSFVEIEALDTQGLRSEEVLSHQCNYYIDLLKLNRDSFIPHSYADLLKLNKQDLS